MGGLVVDELGDGEFSCGFGGCGADDGGGLGFFGEDFVLEIVDGELVAVGGAGGEAESERRSHKK